MFTHSVTILTGLLYQRIFWSKMVSNKVGLCPQVMLNIYVNELFQMLLGAFGYADGILALLRTLNKLSVCFWCDSQVLKSLQSYI